MTISLNWGKRSAKVEVYSFSSAQYVADCSCWEEHEDVVFFTCFFILIRIFLMLFFALYQWLVPWMSMMGNADPFVIILSLSSCHNNFCFMFIFIYRLIHIYWKIAIYKKKLRSSKNIIALLLANYIVISSFSRLVVSYFMEILYKNIRHGYARIDKEGKLLITIPISKKWTTFEDIMITKGQQLLKRYNKRTHIKSIQEDSIVIFGEQVPLEEFYQQYPQKKQPSILHIPPSTSKFLKKILEEYATPILDLYSKKIGIPYKKLSIRKTISKRGSCTYDQKISLNLDLIHLPTKYIKYVIIHEVCHLKVKNHSKRFREVVESFCPQYKETKKELRKFVIK